MRIEVSDCFTSAGDLEGKKIVLPTAFHFQKLDDDEIEQERIFKVVYNEKTCFALNSAFNVRTKKTHQFLINCKEGEKSLYNILFLETEDENLRAFMESVDLLEMECISDTQIIGTKWYRENMALHFYEVFQTGALHATRGVKFDDGNVMKIKQDRLESGQYSTSERADDCHVMHFGSASVNNEITRHVCVFQNPSKVPYEVFLDGILFQVVLWRGLVESNNVFGRNSDEIDIFSILKPTGIPDNRYFYLEMKKLKNTGIPEVWKSLDDKKKCKNSETRYMLGHDLLIIREGSEETQKILLEFSYSKGLKYFNLTEYVLAEEGVLTKTCNIQNLKYLGKPTVVKVSDNTDERDPWRPLGILQDKFFIDDEVYEKVDSTSLNSYNQNTDVLRMLLRKKQQNGGPFAHLSLQGGVGTHSVENVNPSTISWVGFNEPVFSHHLQHTGLHGVRKQFTGEVVTYSEEYVHSNSHKSWKFVLSPLEFVACEFLLWNKVFKPTSLAIKIDNGQLTRVLVDNILYDVINDHPCAITCALAKHRECNYGFCIHKGELMMLYVQKHWEPERPNESQEFGVLIASNVDLSYRDNNLRCSDQEVQIGRGSYSLKFTSKDETSHEFVFDENIYRCNVQRDKGLQLFLAKPFLPEEMLEAEKKI